MLVIQYISKLKYGWKDLTIPGIDLDLMQRMVYILRNVADVETDAVDVVDHGWMIRVIS